MKRDNLKNKILELIDQYYNIKVPNKDKGIPLSDLNYGPDEIKSALTALLDGWISQGKNVIEFEKLFSNKVGVKYGIATNSGSSSNLIALNAARDIYGLNVGDQVIVPASTFATVAMPIIQLGLIPMYVDIDRRTLNINTDEIKNAINERTKIIMPVHTLGLPSDMPTITDIADDKKLIVVEDCCEAHGASIDNKIVGSWGLVSTFSFFVAHNMTTGEGGMILTDDERLYKRCQSLREFGRYKDDMNNGESYYNDDILTDYDKRYVFSEIGYNMRMTDICAALGIEQTKKLDQMNQIRLRNANHLRKNIKSHFSKYFELPKINQDYNHSYYTFSFTLTEECHFSRRELCEYLESFGIETRPMMAGTLPDQPGLRNSPGITCGDLINSRYIRDNTLFIGVHPLLDLTHMDYILQIINDFLNN